MRNGSITVFLALVLVLVLSFVFSLLEGARVLCLNAKANLLTELCMQSLFGNYHQGLWDDYHLLFLDGAWNQETFSIGRFEAKAMEELQENLSSAQGQTAESFWELTALQPQSFAVLSYELATDEQGRVFQDQVARQMRLEAAEDVLQEILQIQDLKRDTEQKKQEAEHKWQNAWDAMDAAEQEQQKQQKQEAQNQAQQETTKSGASASVPGGESSRPSTDESGGGTSRPSTDESGGGTSRPNTATSGKEPANPESGAAQTSELENPMEYVRQLRTSAVLSVVVSDLSKLSNKTAGQRERLQKRQLNEGTLRTRREDEITSRLWLHYYIQKFFSNYTAASEQGPSERALDYEMEYLIGGRSADRENLEVVVYELLAVREALNFATLMGDAAKKGLALEIATAAVGFTGLLPLVQAVQIGILLAWAFVESVLDIRSLLEGKRIPFLKRTDQWSSDLTDSKKTVESGQKADEAEQGLNYTQYLQLLLLLQPDSTISYRCMDLMEGNEQVRMDHMLYSVEGSGDYQANPLFWNLVTVPVRGWDSFAFTATRMMTYGALP